MSQLLVNQTGRAGVLFVFVLCLLFPLPSSAKPKEGADVRVLIDVSGSMRQNDPANLRRPALRMLVGLMQPGTVSGVWTFGRWVNMLVPVGEVDEAWKRKALALSNEINSPGQFTNIEDVLERASRGWEGAKATRHRHLVLLTDGMVDISKSERENAASRQRILDRLLPRIKAQDAQIHAIALSERADHELLKRLAAETGGWYEQINDADRLKRIFLRIFEKVGNPDMVPLKDNAFRVDKRVQEATIVVFQPDGAAPARLTAPDGSAFGRENAPPTVTWHQDEGYELITLREPQAGQWRLQAEMDPDNRVMVVTDLRLDVSSLPNQLVVGEPVLVSASLSSQGKQVKRRAFLDLVDMRADAISAVGLDPLPLNDKGQRGDEQAGDGRYSMLFSENQAHPVMELVIAAESATFLREKRHSLSVVEPALLTHDGAAGARLTLEPGALRENTLKISFWQQDASGQELALSAQRQSDGSWLAEQIDPALPVAARIEGVTVRGAPVSRRLPWVYPAGGGPAVVPVPVVAKPVKAVVPAMVPVQPASEPPAAPAVEEAPVEAAVEEPEEEEDDWLIPGLIIGLSNLLLIGGGVAFWLLRRRRKQAVSLLEEELPPAEDEGTEDAAAVEEV